MRTFPFALGTGTMGDIQSVGSVISSQMSSSFILSSSFLTLLCREMGTLLAVATLYGVASFFYLDLDWCALHSTEFYLIDSLDQFQGTCCFSAQ